MLGAAGFGEVETVSQGQRVGVTQRPQRPRLIEGRQLDVGMQQASSTLNERGQQQAPVTKFVKRVCQISLPHMMTRCYKNR